MKKLFVSLTLLAALCLTLVGCGTTSDSSEKKMTDEELLATSSATMGMIFGQYTVHPTGGIAGVRSVNSRIDQSGIEEKINPYMELIEGFIGESPITSAEKTSDREGYDKLLETTVKDFEGGTAVYSLYYNQVLVAFGEDDEEQDEETEKEYSLSGLLVFSGNEFAVEGKREIEEGEYEFSLKASIDGNNYITFEQEIENGEQEFNYAIYENGRCTSFSIEVENEDGEQSIEFKTELLGVKTSSKFSKVVSADSTYIKAEINSGEERLEFKIFIELDEDGNKSYRYEFDVD